MNETTESTALDHVRAFIGLGSNIEPREGYLTSAVERLRRVGDLTRISSVYETAPLGGIPQADYLNAVVELRTQLRPLELVHHLKTLERALGRTVRPRWHERELDLDLLFYNSLVLKSPELTIPHPEIPRRAFVLVPLSEIAPNFIHPILHSTIQDLTASIEISGVRKIAFYLA